MGNEVGKTEQSQELIRLRGIAVKFHYSFHILPSFFWKSWTTSPSEVLLSWMTWNWNQVAPTHLIHFETICLTLPTRFLFIFCLYPRSCFSYLTLNREGGFPFWMTGPFQWLLLEHPPTQQLPPSYGRSTLIFVQRKKLPERFPSRWATWLCHLDVCVQYPCGWMADELVCWLTSCWANTRRIMNGWTEGWMKSSPSLSNNPRKLPNRIPVSQEERAPTTAVPLGFQ